MTLPTRKDCTCRNYDPAKPCPYHEAKARIMAHEESTNRDYEPEIAAAQEAHRADERAIPTTTPEVWIP